MENIIAGINSFGLDAGLWMLILVCGFTWGVAKAGIKGIGIVAIPVMAFIFGSKASTGVVLPMLLMADVFAVIYYRRDANWGYLIKLMPWTVIGVLLAVWLGDHLVEATFKKLMASLVIFCVFLILWFERRKNVDIPDFWWFAALMGIGAGFTTMIGNVAGAIVTIYLLSMRLPKDSFIGTGAWFFFLINIFKIPLHIFFWGTITTATFSINLLSLPAIALGFFFGVYIVKRIRDDLYRRLVLILTVLASIALFF